MSLRSGLTIFGMSAALGVVGGAAINEWDDKSHEVRVDRACLADQSEILPDECENRIITDETIEQTERIASIYGWVGAISLIGAGLGLVGAYIESADSTYELVEAVAD